MEKRKELEKRDLLIGRLMIILTGAMLIFTALTMSGNLNVLLAFLVTAVASFTLDKEGGALIVGTAMSIGHLGILIILLMTGSANIIGMIPVVWIISGSTYQLIKGEL